MHCQAQNSTDVTTQHEQMCARGAQHRQLQLKTAIACTTDMRLKHKPTQPLPSCFHQNTQDWVLKSSGSLRAAACLFSSLAAVSAARVACGQVLRFLAAGIRKYAKGTQACASNM
jgi:hypothetical protein